MSKFFSLCKTNRRHWLTKSNHKNQRAPQTRVNYFYHYGSGLLFLVIIFSSIFYLLNITSFATDGFKITAGEENYKNLKLTNEDLEARLRSLVDLGTIQEKAQTLGLNSVSDINYITALNNGVAVNK